MGSALAKAAGVRFAGLPGNQFKVLTKMCWMALDTPNGKGDPARLYFGGWEPLALALGRDVPPDTADEANQRRRKRLQQEATTTCSALCKAGAIRRRVDHPQTGDRQVYEVFPTTDRVDDSPTQTHAERVHDSYTQKPTDRVHDSPTHRVHDLPTQEGARIDPDRVHDLPTPTYKDFQQEDLRKDPTRVGDQRYVARDLAHDNGDDGSDGLGDDDGVRAALAAGMPNPAQPHDYEPDEHDVACLVCQLPAGHRRHRTRKAS